MSGRKVVVTGAAGFLGCHLIAELIERDAEIRALVRPGGSRLPPEIADAVEEVEVDLCRSESLKKHFEGVELVFHLAGRYLPGKSDSLLEELRPSNVETTRNVVAASLEAGVSRFIHLSSCAAGEESGRELVTEDTGFPVTSYGISKKEGEKIFRDIPIDRMAWTIFRPTVIFGEHRENPITRMASAIRSGRFIVFGNGENFVNFIYAGDVVSALLQSAEADVTHGKIYQLADEPIHFSELIEIIRTSAGFPGVIRRLPSFVGHFAGAACDVVSLLTGWKMPLSKLSVRFMTRSMIYSNAKLKSEAGIEPRSGVREGVERTIRWFMRDRIDRRSVPN